MNVCLLFVSAKRHQCKHNIAVLHSLSRRSTKPKILIILRICNFAFKTFHFRLMGGAGRKWLAESRWTPGCQGRPALGGTAAGHAAVGERGRTFCPVLPHNVATVSSEDLGRCARWPWPCGGGPTPHTPQHHSRKNAFNSQGKTLHQQKPAPP